MRYLLGEAEYIVHQIEKMVGGNSYFSLDSGRVADDENTAWEYIASPFSKKSSMLLELSTLYESTPKYNQIYTLLLYLYLLFWPSFWLML